MNNNDKLNEPNESKITRRKLLSSLGIAGAAVATGSALMKPVFGAAVTEQVYGDNSPVLLQTNPPSVINVKDFGAQGTGDVNDQPAIQSALNAAQSNGGGEVIIPPGVYYCQSQLNMPSNVVLSGSGIDISILKISSNTNGIVNYSPSNGNTNVKIRTIAIKKESKTPNSPEAAVYFQNSTNVTIESVKVEGWSGHGIFPYRSNSVLINNCYAVDCGYSSNIGSTFKAIGCNECSQVIITNCFVNNCKGGNIQEAIGCSVSSKVIVSNCIIDNCDYGINLQRCDDCTVDGNVISNSIVIGIDHSNGCKANVISNNNVFNSGNDGIRHWGNSATGAESTVITGNTCRDNGRTDVHSAGIRLDKQNNSFPAKLNIISNNICYDTRSGAARTQDYGLFIPQGNGFNKIEGNLCYNNKISNEFILDYNNKPIVERGEAIFAPTNEVAQVANIIFKTPFSASEAPIFAGLAVQAGNSGDTIQNINVSVRDVSNNGAQLVIATTDGSPINSKAVSNITIGYVVRGKLS